MAAELLTCWQVWQSYHKTERCSLFCHRMCYTVTFTASVIDMLPRDAMHKHGVCRYAVSVRLSVTFVDHVKTNKHIFEIFLPSGNHTILVFPYQTGWRYSDGNPPNGGVECRWGIGRNRDSGLIAGYRRLLDVRSANNIYRRQSWVYDTVGHAPLAMDHCWTCELRSDKNSCRRPCSVDRTVGDAPANVCDGLQHGPIRRREEKQKRI